MWNYFERKHLDSMAVAVGGRGLNYIPLCHFVGFEWPDKKDTNGQGAAIWDFNCHPNFPAKRQMTSFARRGTKNVTNFAEKTLVITEKKGQIFFKQIFII